MTYHVRPEEITRVQHALLAHKGRASGIKAERLAMACGISERDLRACITELRLQGFAIAGTPGTGYYIAETAEEMDECCAFLEHRLIKTATILSRLRNLSMPELYGQMRLKAEAGPDMKPLTV